MIVFPLIHLVGLKAATKRNSKAFSELDESGADKFLHEISDGKVTDERVQLASWFNELVYPLCVTCADTASHFPFCFAQQSV